MRIRTTTAGILTVLALTLTACGSSDEPAPEKPANSSTPASPTADQAAAEQACKDAWLQGLEDGSVSAEDPPAACGGLPNTSRLGAEAIRERNAANRERLENCPEPDPTLCIEKSIP